MLIKQTHGWGGWGVESRGGGGGGGGVESRGGGGMHLFILCCCPNCICKFRMCYGFFSLLVLTLFNPHLCYSDTGSDSPESCIFSFVCSVGAILGNGDAETPECYKVILHPGQH